MHALVSSPGFSADFWSFAVDLTVKSSALLALALLAVRCLRRCSAAIRHFILLLAFGGIVALPLLTWILPQVKVLPAWLNVRSAPPDRVSSANATSLAVIDSIAPVASPAASSVSTSTGPSPAATPPAAAHATSSPSRAAALLAWAPALWAFGAAAGLAPLIFGLLSLHRLHKRSHVVREGPLQDALHALFSTRPTRRAIQLLTSSRRAMPMTWGVFRPVILLPEPAATWPADTQRFVLLHELAHIRRGDFASTLFVRCMCALLWFNPFVWLAARELRLQQEQACDDAVLNAGTRPDGYAEEVLRLAAGRGLTGLEALGALAMARPSTLETRLLAILDRTRNRTALSRPATLAASTLLGALLVPLAMLRAGQPSASANPPASPALTSAGVDRGLVAWWRGDDDAKDSAGKHDGTTPFGISYLPGMVGQAFDFRRSFAIRDLLPRVSVPDSPDFQLSDSFTLEVRIHPRSPSGIVLIRGDDRPGFDTWQVDLLTPGKISFNFDSVENKSVELLAPIQFNKWQHVVATFDRGAMKLYIDGVLAAETQTELRPNRILDPRHDPALGIGNAGGKEYNIPFDGLIDEVRIYNRALSPGEITDRATRN